MFLVPFLFRFYVCTDIDSDIYNSLYCIGFFTYYLHLLVSNLTLLFRLQSHKRFTRSASLVSQTLLRSAPVPELLNLHISWNSGPSALLACIVRPRVVCLAQVCTVFFVGLFTATRTSFSLAGPSPCPIPSLCPSCYWLCHMH